MSQNQRIMNHLGRFGSISTKEAMDMYGIFRLPARVKELRKAGNNIVTTWEREPNRFGEMTRYARYRMV